MDFAESLQQIQLEIDNNVYSKDKDSHEAIIYYDSHTELHSNQPRNEETSRDKEIPRHEEMPWHEETQLPPVRQSFRPKATTKHLEEFPMELPPSLEHSETTSTTHPFSNFVSYEKFSKSHRAFLASITSHDEPKNFAQADLNLKWREAMSKEIQALKEKGVWILTDLLPGKKATESKWVYKIKYNPDG